MTWRGPVSWLRHSWARDATPDLKDEAHGGDDGGRHNGGGPGVQAHDAWVMVVARAGVFFVMAYPRSSNGLREFDGWFRVLTPGADDHLVGEAILEGLQHADQRRGWRAPALSRERPDALLPVYRAAGVVDAETFVTGARCVTVEAEDGYEVNVLAADAASGGFTGVAEPATQMLRSAPPSDLGAEVLRGLARRIDPPPPEDSSHT